MSRPNYFCTSICPLSINFAAKFNLRSETYISYKVYSRYHQKWDLLEGILCLCVENVMHVLDPFFVISGHGVGRLFTYKVSVVISGQIGFALKIAL